MKAIPCIECDWPIDIENEPQAFYLGASDAPEPRDYAVCEDCRTDFYNQSAEEQFCKSADWGDKFKRWLEQPVRTGE